MDNGSELYRRFLDGDEQGLVEIIRTYREGLFLYINNIVKDATLAEELTEETFVKLCLRCPRDKQTGSFKTWIYTIGRRVALDHYRKQKRRMTVPLEDTMATDGYSPEKEFLREERKQQVYRALAQLPITYRQVLYFVYFEELSHRQIAAVLGKRVHAVDTLVYRAREALKKELLQEGFQYEEL